MYSSESRGSGAVVVVVILGVVLSSPKSLLASCKTLNYQN